MPEGIPRVWRGTKVVCDPLGQSTEHDLHYFARAFTKVIRSAPCLETVRCNRGMLPPAREAINLTERAASRQRRALTRWHRPTAPPSPYTAIKEQSRI